LPVRAVVFAIRIGSVTSAWSFARNLARDETVVAMPSLGRVWAGPGPLPSPGVAELLLTNFHGSQVDTYFGGDGAFVCDVANARQKNLSGYSGSEKHERSGDENREQWRVNRGH